MCRVGVPGVEPRRSFQGSGRGGVREKQKSPRRLAAVVKLERRLAALRAALGAAVAKGLFKLKLVAVAGSMIVSVGAYALVGGWWFGVGLVGMVFVHELGHVLALRRLGVRASAPLFIPFVGAVIGVRGMPRSAWMEAQVALAGPLLGSAGAACVWLVAIFEHSRFLTALAFLGFLINLFNLIPVVPLDGGRAAAALHPAIWLLGLAGLAVVAVARPSPILTLLLLIGSLELWRRWRARGLQALARYYSVGRWQRLTVASVYLGLAGSLVLGMIATNQAGSL